MSSNKPFVCDICTKIFTRNENLERHKRSKHGGDTHRPYECPRCQSAFSRKDVCKRHAERCRGPRPKTRKRLLDLGPVEELASSIHVRPLEAELSLRGAEHPVSNSPGELGIGDASAQSPLQSLHSGSVELQSNVETYISAYSEYFHPSLPLLHQSAVNAHGPPLLLNIIAAIGCLYTANTLPVNDAASCVELSQTLWIAGHDEIHRMAQSAWKGFRRPWMMQAWLLHIIYGAYMGDVTQYSKAKNLLRKLVDCVQDLGLLKQSVAYPDSKVWIKAYTNREISMHDESDLQNYWMMFVSEESMKICMHTLMLLDFQVLYPCNIRSLTSAVDFDWELPFSSSLWTAESAETWLQTLNDDPRVLALLEPEENLYLACPTTKSLTLAMQSLMSDNPSLNLLSALESSPITIIFLLNSVDAFVRDMTRCLYQLPPNLADPSAFHILSQSQNRQVAAVLRHISRLVEEQPETAQFGPERPLWTAIGRMCLALKIALYKPDDLLIGGIVDTNITAGLATATHLTLGHYTGSRRSLHSLIQHNSGDDAVLLFLEEAISALDAIFASSRQDSISEAPWVTVMTYRILLAIWRSTRWAATEMRNRAGSGARSHFDTPTVIFNSVLGVVSDRIGLRFAQENVPSPSSSTGEMCFSQAILQFWKERSVWAMGASMVPILEEIISADI